MSAAKSAKKSQTRALGGALNKILGKNVFSEHKLYDLRKIMEDKKDLIPEALASGIISKSPSRVSPGASLRNMVQIAKILKEMKESDVRDARGNVVIEPGLKVRHKKSGLEYSVQDIEDAKGKVKIVLAVPEMPRVDATKTFPSVVTEKDEAQHLDNIIDAAEAHQETIFVVDEKEFDKDYEVK